MVTVLSSQSDSSLVTVILISLFSVVNVVSVSDSSAIVYFSYNNLHNLTM